MFLKNCLLPFSLTLLSSASAANKNRHWETLWGNPLGRRPSGHHYEIRRGGRTAPRRQRQPAPGLGRGAKPLDSLFFTGFPHAGPLSYLKDFENAVCFVRRLTKVRPRITRAGLWRARASLFSRPRFLALRVRRRGPEEAWEEPEILANSKWRRHRATKFVIRPSSTHFADASAVKKRSARDPL